MRLSSTVALQRPAVHIGELSPVQRRVVTSLIAGATAAAIVPNDPKNEMDPAAIATPAGSAPEVCGATAPTD